MNPILQQLRDEAYADAGAAWTITRDVLGGEPQVVGRTGPRTAPPRDDWSNPTEFRLIDDDGEVYYLGVLDDDPEGISQSAALEWGETHAGTTSIEVLIGGQWVREIG